MRSLLVLSGRMSLVAGLLAVAACGGESATSITSEALVESSAAPSTADPTAPPNDSTVAEPSVTTQVVGPVELLIDGPHDIDGEIAAIGGPVVLWFWAPG